jgi:hypothetical protein
LSRSTDHEAPRCVFCAPLLLTRSGNAHDKWVPVTTAWRVLRLRMEERPEGRCEYSEE